MQISSCYHYSFLTNGLFSQSMNIKIFTGLKSSGWLLYCKHRIRIHSRATRVRAFEVFEAAHVALRTLLAFSQPVNCIFWPIGMLNWLVAASKLHKHRVTCCTAEWPFYSFLILCCKLPHLFLGMCKGFDFYCHC